MGTRDSISTWINWNHASCSFFLNFPKWMTFLSVGAFFNQRIVIDDTSKGNGYLKTALLNHLNWCNSFLPTFKWKTKIKSLPLSLRGFSWLNLTLIGMRQGGFIPLMIFGLDFVSWTFIKNFQTYLELKIEIKLS